eukprot:3171446-Pyramimonas_sp.AAC.1
MVPVVVLPRQQFRRRPLRVVRPVGRSLGVFIQVALVLVDGGRCVGAAVRRDPRACACELV